MITLSKLLTIFGLHQVQAVIFDVKGSEPAKVV